MSDFDRQAALGTPVAVPLGPNTANNRLTGSNWAYDAAGNMTTHGGWTLAYDAVNRMKTSQPSGGSVTSYVYDADGRRVKKTTGSVHTYFVYDAFGQLAAEYSSTNPTGSTETHYLTTDHLGSTRLVTNQTGAVVSRHDYLPFGWELYSGLTGRTTGHGYLTSPESVATPTQRFTGKERDSETRLDYFGARYYSAGPGRFTSADAPFADQFPENPQSWNLYAYVRNNPTGYIDPDGKQTMMGGTTFVPSGKEADTFIGLAKGYVNSLLKSENLNLGVLLRAAGVGPQFASNPHQQAGMNAYPAVESAVVIGMAVVPLARSVKGSSGPLPNEAIVVRGGTNSAESFAKGSGVTRDASGNLKGVSVNSAPGKSLQELSEGLPHGKVGTTTVGEVRAAGGEVRPDPTPRNPYHCELCGISAEKASELMEVIPNPSRPRPGGNP